MHADPGQAGPRSVSHQAANRTPPEGGNQVSAAWARVAGGSGSLNAWYQSNRPRSADAWTGSYDEASGSGKGKLDEKWIAFARQEVAELRLPSLQPQATFLL
jgi:hypothetical protein